MRIKILYEDKNILAIDKPSGISVHPDGKSKEKTISDWFAEKYPKSKNVGEPLLVDGQEIKKSGVVHRLDKETSGVLLLVKNQKAYEFFKKQFSAPALELQTKGEIENNQDRIKKTYITVVNGWVKDEHGMINKPIGRSPKDFRRYLAGRGARGEMREAITAYRVLKKFELPKKSCAILDKKNKLEKEKYQFSLLEVRPKTGRTHQIRVHMKYINHPVVCDNLYNPKNPYPKNFSRLALHAKSIEFKNINDETIKIESPVPKEFKDLQTKKTFN